MLWQSLKEMERVLTTSMHALRAALRPHRVECCLRHAAVSDCEIVARHVTERWPCMHTPLVCQDAWSVHYGCGAPRARVPIHVCVSYIWAKTQELGVAASLESCHQASLDK